MNILGRKNKKKCPRCGNVCLQGQPRCDECKLVFSRLDNATNKAAKKQFFKKDRAIVYVQKTPSDVKKWVLILLSIFLGPFGAHNFYIGRFYKAIFMALFSGILSVVLLVPQTDFILSMLNSPFLILPSAFIAYFWIVDLVQIIFGKYKIPVAISEVV